MSNNWQKSLSLLHIICPQSRGIVLSINDFEMDKLYQVFKKIDPCCLNNRNDYDTNNSSEEILKLILNHQIFREKGRVIAIHDLGDFRVEPIIISANKLFEKISEGVPLNDISKIESTEFIGGGDTLFVFETSGTLLIFDHHEKYCMVTPGAAQSLTGDN